MQALAAVRALLDPTDERYEAQQGLAAAGALTALATLIRDASESVSADAAQTTEQLLRHSSVVTTRCAGQLVFSMNRVSSVRALSCDRRWWKFWWATGASIDGGHMIHTECWHRPVWDYKQYACFSSRIACSVPATN